MRAATALLGLGVTAAAAGLAALSVRSAPRAALGLLAQTPYPTRVVPPMPTRGSPTPSASPGPSSTATPGPVQTAAPVPTGSAPATTGRVWIAIDTVSAPYWTTRADGVATWAESGAPVLVQLRPPGGPCTLYRLVVAEVRE